MAAVNLLCVISGFGGSYQTYYEPSAGLGAIVRPTVCHQLVGELLDLLCAISWLRG